jgi:hypothetical protein
MNRAFAGPRRVGGKTKLSSKRTVVNQKSDGGLYVSSQESSSDVIFEYDPLVLSISRFGSSANIPGVATKDWHIVQQLADELATMWPA